MSRVPDPRPLCLYHKNCLDGSTAAAVVARKHPDADFLPVQYGTHAPTVEGRLVYLVDFGFPLAQMRALRAQAREVVWIDHHTSQEETRRALGWGVLDTADCAASLAWKTLFPREPEPAVIAFVRDKDLWKWELPASRAIAAGMGLAFTDSRFAGILETDLDAMRRQGEPLLAKMAARVGKAAAKGVAVSEPFGLTGRRALVVDCHHDLNDLGDHICQPPERGGLGFDLAILCYRKLPGKWVHSLRSNGRVDCAAVSGLRGGGGHLQSACYLSPVHFLDSTDCPAALRRRTMS